MRFAWISCDAYSKSLGGSVCFSMQLCVRMWVYVLCALLGDIHLHWIERWLMVAHWTVNPQSQWMDSGMSELVKESKLTQIEKWTRGCRIKQECARHWARSNFGRGHSLVFVCTHSERTCFICALLLAVRYERNSHRILCTHDRYAHSEHFAIPCTSAQNCATVHSSATLCGPST